MVFGRVVKRLDCRFPLLVQRAKQETQKKLGVSGHQKIVDQLVRAVA
jgi:hypothetical protein